MKPALYIRVSTEDQREGETIENQWLFAESYRKLQLPGHPWAEVYRDDGVSGMIPVEKRPEGARMLRDLEAGRWDTLFVFRVSRLGRSLLQLLRCVEMLDRKGAAVRSMTEPFDTTTHVGKFILAMLGSVAQLERDNIREQTQLGHLRVAREGGWNGGSPSFGYRVENRRLVIHEPEAAIVREIFQLYLDGMTTTALAQYLNARAVPTASQLRGIEGRGARWLDTSVLLILKNSTYVGERIYRKRRVLKEDGEEIGREKAPPDYRVASPSPALVSREVFDQVQERIRTNFQNSRRNSKEEYLLRGLIRCGRCGYTFCGGTQRRGERVYRYYSCGQNPSGHRGPGCTAKRIRCDELEETVWADLVGFLQNPDPVLAQLEARARDQLVQQKPLEREAAALDRDLAGLQEGRERILGLFRRGRITEAELERQLTEVAGEVAALESRRARLFSQQVEISNLKTRLVEADALLTSLRDTVDRADFAGKRKAVTLLVDQILVETVGEGDARRAEVTITYLFERASRSCPVPTRHSM